jgi:hypothetical protein
MVNVRQSSYQKYMTLLTLGPLLFTGIIAILRPSLWFQFLPVASDVQFLDLSLLTFNVDCVTDSNTDLSKISCDPGGRDFNYPSILLVLFHFMHLDSSHTFAVGLTLFLLLVMSLAVLIRVLIHPNLGITEAIMWAGAFVSPPILLLVERGNIDSLLFLLFVIALVFARNRGLILFISVIGFSLKIYLLGMSIFGLKKKDLGFIFSALILSGTWFIWKRDDFLRVFNYSDYFEWNSFGLRALPIQLFDYFGFHPPGKMLFLLSNLFGLLLFLVLFLALVALTRKSMQISFFNFSTELSSYRFCMAGGVWSLIFFVGLNFDMRMIFVFPIFLQLENGIRRKLLPVLLVVLFSAFGPYWLQSIGDLLLHLFTVLVVHQLFLMALSNFSLIRLMDFFTPKRRDI